MSSSPAFESMYPVRDDTPDEPAPAVNHPPVLSRLRPRKRKDPPVLPTTPRRKPTKRARNRRNSSSPPPLMSSPYRLLNAQLVSGPAESSPYRFDEEFYHQGPILNGNIDADAATYGTANNRHKKRMRDAHEQIINSAKLEEYEPLDMPDPPRPMRSHLPDSAVIDNPGSFFDIFLKDDDFEMIAANTNKYAEQYTTRHPTASQRRFNPTNRIEIRVYFAILIFMGIHRHNNPKTHWEKPIRGSPVYRMSWKRYEHLKTMIKVSDVDQDDEHADVPGDWHYKVSPLDERLMERFQDAVTLGSRVTYDEQMLPFRGRSPHVTKVPGKPHPDGFKVWALCERGYLYDWLYFSGSAGTAGIQEVLSDYPTLTPTTAGVLACALNLPKVDANSNELKYTIFTDNLFTSYKLYSILRQHGIAACGTARQNRMGEHFKEEMDDKNNGKILVWGEVRTHVEIRDGGEPVLFFIWQDQTVVRGMTTAHDGEGYMLRNRRRPKDSSSMPQVTKSIFEIPKTDNMTEKQARRFFSSKLALPIIRAIDDYNHHMNGVDIADQLREEYSIAQVTRRNWMVYMFWLVDSAIINAFILWRMEALQQCVGHQNERMRTQRAFREAIIEHLLMESPEPRLQFNIVVGKHHRFIEPNRRHLPLQHHMLQPGMPCIRCYMCRIKTLRGELRKEDERFVRTGCLVCEVPLCGPCFMHYHQL